MTSGRGNQNDSGAATQRQQGGSASSAARRRAAERQYDQRPWILAGVVGAVLVVLLVVLAVREMTRPQPGVRIADLGNTHVATLDAPHEPYNSSPPTSGPHVGGIAPNPVYNVQIPNELQVHNLEDGFVMVQYNCPEGCDDLVAQLAEVTADYQGRHVVLAPYAPIHHPETGASHRIALTAWTRIDVFDDFDEERIRAFIEAYEGIDHHVPGVG
jgi:hypothetical protein